MRDAKAQDRAVPFGSLDIIFFDITCRRMLPYRVSPETQCADIAPCDRSFPLPRITAEDRMSDSGANAAAAVFTHDEEFRHVAVHRKSAMRVIIDQRKSRQMPAALYQQRNMAVLMPVGFEIRVFGKQAVVAQFASLHVRPLFREVMH